MRVAWLRMSASGDFINASNAAAQPAGIGTCRLPRDGLLKPAEIRDALLVGLRLGDGLREQVRGFGRADRADPPRGELEEHRNLAVGRELQRLRGVLGDERFQRVPVEVRQVVVGRVLGVGRAASQNGASICDGIALSACCRDRDAITRQIDADYRARFESSRIESAIDVAVRSSQSRVG